MLEEKNIAFLGSGNIAKSVVDGLLAQSFPVTHIWVAGRNPEKLAQFTDLGVHTVNKAAEAVLAADIVILCVKPGQIQALYEEIKPAVMEKNPLVVSLAAGVGLKQLTSIFGEGLSLMRAMPNTPCALSAGVIGLIANVEATSEQKEWAESLFRTTGATFWLSDDDDINKVTALAGSGPAYLFLFMEALHAAAVKSGLSDEDALFMTKQTVLGAARVAIESKASMSELRQAVTSKGGTTQAAISALQDGEFEKLLKDAYQAALARARFIESQFEA